jgi:putative transposase
MARLRRLSLPGVVHYVLQRGHNHGAITHNAEDSERLLQTLREAALGSGVVLHAFALTATELRVLATPDSATGISRMMQALGRRYAAAFNRRHGRRGALWEGRFRSALIEAGEPTLQALRQLDAAAAADMPDGVERSSLPHRTGGRRDAALIDPPEYWHLGNTPFDRESRYRQLLAEPPAAAVDSALRRAVEGAWAYGSPTFLQGLAADTDRPAAPRPRGRPRRAAQPG